MCTISVHDEIAWQKDRDKRIACHLSIYHQGLGKADRWSGLTFRRETLFSPNVHDSRHD